MGEVKQSLLRPGTVRMTAEAIEVIITNDGYQNRFSTLLEARLRGVWTDPEMKVLNTKIVEHSVVEITGFKPGALVRAQVVPRRDCREERLFTGDQCRRNVVRCLV